MSRSLFNYGKFHYFDKNGHELMLKKTYGLGFDIPNGKHPESYSSYGFVSSTPGEDACTYNWFADNVLLENITTGERYNINPSDSSIKVKTYLPDGSTYNEVIVNDSSYTPYTVVSYTSSNGTEYRPEISYNDMSTYNRTKFIGTSLHYETSDYIFPSLTFAGQIHFDKISTGLVETQKLYVLVDNPYVTDEYGISNYTTVKELADTEPYNDSSSFVKEPSVDIIALENINLVADKTCTIVVSTTKTLSGTVEFNLHKSDGTFVKRIARIITSGTMAYETFTVSEDMNDAFVVCTSQRNATDTITITLRQDTYDDVLDASNYIDRYKLFFFIDQRTQQDFRFFHLEADNLVWTDRCFLDFKRGLTEYSDGDGYSVNIGFCGENEGVYEQSMYICVLDTSTADETNDYPGDVYPIGEIKLIAETEGEDERYRALFANFGIPDPITYDDVFKDSEKHADDVDYMSINRHSKEMFLTYSEIFPYVGSYKALINATQLLGYDDIFFKEWYKEMGKSTVDDNGYVAFDMEYKSDSKSSVIGNVPLEERIHLKKLNWLSMMYALNEETDDPEDKWGFPTTIKKSNYYTSDSIVKLISLKKWLEKYILGINCRITDIGGEGVVFERYSLPKFGQYQQVLDYTNEKSLSCIAINDTEILQDGSANLHINVTTADYGTTIEDCKGMMFIDYCTGYLDSSANGSTYHLVDNDTVDSSAYIYCGKTFELDDNINSFELRAKGTHETFKFCNDPEFNNRGEYISYDRPAVFVDDDIFIDPINMNFKNSPFENLPIIRIEKGIISRYKDGYENEGQLKYKAVIEKDDVPEDGVSYRAYIYRDGSTGYSEVLEFQDTIDLIPPTNNYNPKSADPTTIKPITSDTSTSKSSSYIIQKDFHYAYQIYDKDAGDYDTKPAMSLNGDKTMNLGLRFTYNTPDGIPCFMIIGYEEPSVYFNDIESDKHFPDLCCTTETTTGFNLGYEYYIEILEGCMIFNDEKNNRKVSLNFSYDEDTKKVSHSITTLNYSTMSVLYSYKDSSTSYVDRFTPNVSYDYFRNVYDTDVYEAILHNTEKTVNVINAGDYEVSVLLSDEFNNIFSTKANKVVRVLTSDIDSSTCIQDSSSNNYYNTPGFPEGYITKIEINKDTSTYGDCMFKYSRKQHISSFNRDNLSFDVTPDYRTLSHNEPDEGSFVQISSLSEKMQLYRSFVNNDKMFYVFVREQFTNSDDSSKGYIYVDSSIEMDKIFKANPGITLGDYVALLNEYENIDLSSANSGQLSLLSCYLVIYDQKTESPLYCFPGTMCPIGQLKNLAIDEYVFKPLKTYATEINNVLTKLILKTPLPYDFYFIPTWMLNGENFKYDASNNIISIEHNQYLFDRTIQKDNIIKMAFSGNYVLQNNMKLYGQSSYYCDDSIIDSFGTVHYELKNTVDPTMADASLSAKGINISFGHGNLEYVNYSKEILDSSDTSINEYIFIDTPGNNEIMEYIDTTYVVSVREFDIFNAKNIWDSSMAFDPQTTGNLMSYNIPVTITDDSSSRYVVVVTNLKEAFPSYTGDNIKILGDEKCTARWRVYRKTGKAKRELLFESFNNMLHMKLFEKADYDIELDVYDNNGNKYSKYLNGAITYK